MPTVIKEDNGRNQLTFEFSDKWQVYKYDEQSKDNFYDNIKNQGIKAVDFIAISEKCILLMEVKYIVAEDSKSLVRFSADVDKDIIAKIKEKLSGEEQRRIKLSSVRPCLPEEIVRKAKDTLLGLYASYRQSDNKLFPYSQALFIEKIPILLILFLQRNDEQNKPEQFKPLASNLKLDIEKKINFLGNITVSVINTLTIPEPLEIKILTAD